MKKLFALFLFSTIVCYSNAQTNVSGVYFTNTTWDISGSPYNLTGNIQIPSGVTLTIDPGVKVTYSGDYEIVISGAINVQGSNSSPIFFNGCSGGSNPMLMFKSADLNNSHLVSLQCYGPKNSVQLANEAEHNEDPTKNSGTLIISNVLFYNTYVITHGYNTTASLVIDSATCLGSTILGVYPRTEPITLKNSYIDNCVINSDAYNYGINIDSSVVTNSSLLIGCCGANINITHSKVTGSSIAEGSGQPVMGPLLISNSELNNVPISLPAATVNISTSVIKNNVSNGIIFGNGIIECTNQTGNNTGPAFEITGLVGYNVGGNVSITNSSISQNSIGIKISNAHVVAIDSSNFINNFQYNLQNLSNVAIAAKDNWWDTTNNAVITAKIYDYYDDINYGQVDFSGYLASEYNSTTCVFDALNFPVGSTFTLTLATAAITSSGATTFCEGGDVTLTASAGSNYLWSNNATTQNIVVSTSGNYSVTVTPLSGCPQTSSGVNVTVNLLPVLAAVSSPDTCTGGVGAVLANVSGGTFPYTYVWSNSATDQAISNLSPGTYSVTVSDSYGCSVSDSDTVRVFTSMIAPTLNTSPDTCFGNVGAFGFPSGGTAPYSFVWSNGSSTGQFSTGLSTGNYTVSITDKNGCGATAITSISTYTSSISVAFFSVPTDCNSAVGSLATNTTGGTNPYSYIWSTGSSSQAVSNLSAGIYTVNIIDKNGCTVKDSTVIGTSASIATPSICMVTVDPASKNNVIMWDKTAFAHIDSFIVYREVAVNNYQAIGSVSYDSLSLFVDTVRAKYFPNTGDPNAGTYRYKLGMKDSCGNISLQSPYHNTIYILNNSGAFSWTQHYTIENAANPVISYILMRDDLSNGSWHAINSVSGTQQTIIDPNYLSYQSTGSWRVETQWGISCNPSLKNPEVQNYNASRSNIYSLTLGVHEYYNNPSVNISPNPFTETATLKITNGNSMNREFKLLDIYGREVMSRIIPEGENNFLIERNNLASGMYFYKLTGNNRIVATGKLSIE